ncbi:MAG: hypothetical protein QOE55_5933, partial [Acidobacteriaceae bacterium]|nr:hypothetical protein [Acidobacteriaceae bacterium]
AQPLGVWLRSLRLALEKELFQLHLP